MSINKLVLTGLLSLLFFIFPIQVANANSLTVVSLTFDDGRDESDARSILASHGMKATFYINSDRVGSGGGFLTRAEVDGLYADGNEIGGHTIGHANLANLSDSEQKAVICNDMQNLLDFGYEVHSFAYPFSSTGSTTQDIVAGGCPGIGTYESARAVGGLTSRTSCFGCPFAESLTPGNRYFISTPNSVISTTTLADLKLYVTQAESNGGGWVPLVFHRICVGCSNLSVSVTILDEFLAWLEQREARGTHVRTVHQVMSGDYPSAPSSDPDPTPTGTNLLTNPSLETDSDGNNQADCWQRAGYGDNAYIWNRLSGSSTAHSGNYAVSLQVTGQTTGNRKLVTQQGSSTCSPNVTSGTQYTISNWYKSTVPARYSVYYRDSGGSWLYWVSSTLTPAINTWGQAVYTTPSVPGGATALSFGLAIDRVGTLVTDDYSMTIAE